MKGYPIYRKLLDCLVVCAIFIILLLSRVDKIFLKETALYHLLSQRKPT